MTDPLEDYRESLADVEDLLIRAERDVDGFVFVARHAEDGDRELRTTFGTHPDGDGFDFVEALGHALLVLSYETGTHPAVLAHGAVSRALELDQQSG